MMDNFNKKPVEPVQPAHVWVGRANQPQAAGSFRSAGNKFARAGTFGEGTKCSRNRAARRNKHKPLFQEAPVERRATMEENGANPPWDARDKEIFVEMEKSLLPSERKFG